MQLDASRLGFWPHDLVRSEGPEMSLTIIQFSKGDLGRGVDDGLLIDPTDALQGADIKVSWAPQ